MRTNTGTLESRSRHGFTLMELLITVVLMAILAALMIPTAQGNIPAQLAGATELIVADLSLARSLAVTNNSEYRLTFTVAQNQYTLEHVGTNTAWDELPTVATKTPSDSTDKYTVRLNEIPGLSSGSVQLHSIRRGTTPVSYLDYEANGSMSPDANQQTEWVTIWLSAGQGEFRRFQSIRVNPVTGLATVGELQTNSP